MDHQNKKNILKYVIIGVIIIIFIFFIYRLISAKNSINHSIIKQLETSEKNLNNTINQIQNNLQTQSKSQLQKYQNEINILRGQIADLKYINNMQNYNSMYTNIPVVHVGHDFYRVGLLLSYPKFNKNKKTENTTILTLYRQNILPERDWYRYKVVDEYSPGRLQIYLPESITLLNNDDKIPSLVGFENKGEFVVKLDDTFRTAIIRN